MPKPNSKYYENLREKKRLAHEHARKKQEERKRAREVKEEKWTIRNEFELTAEHRAIQRKEFIEKMKSEGQAMVENVQALLKCREERHAIIQKEIDDEIEIVQKFTAEQHAYYDEILKQISPPKERSVDEIVEEIRKRLKEIYDMFAGVSQFNAKLPEPSDIEKDGEQMFAKEIAQLEKEIEDINLDSTKLNEQIADAKIQIEEENVKYAAIEQDKRMEILKLEKEVKAMEAKLEFIKQEPPDAEEIRKLDDRIAEETQKQKDVQEALTNLKALIEQRKAEKEAKKKVEKGEACTSGL